MAKGLISDKQLASCWQRRLATIRLSAPAVRFVQESSETMKVLALRYCAGL